MAKIEVSRGNALKPGATTKGISRHLAFDVPGVTFSRSTIKGGNVSDWHHHGARDLFAYVVSGRLRFEFGTGGRDSIEVASGDFFHIPTGLVHRDVNPLMDDTVVATLLLGDGPTVVNVPGP